MSGVDAEIDGLSDLPRAALVESWTEAHGHPPPRGCKRGLLERDHAWRLQARAHGGLKSATRKALLAIASHGAAAAKDIRPRVAPGTRLVREWHGTTHHVEVIEGGGCVWNGKVYSSLSAVARAITGTHWSGPRFFGL